MAEGSVKKEEQGDVAREGRAGAAGARGGEEEKGGRCHERRGHYTFRAWLAQPMHDRESFALTGLA